MLPTTVWCKSLAGEQTASGSVGSDELSVDISCSDTQTRSFGEGDTLVENVTVTGTLYLQPTTQ